MAFDIPYLPRETIRQKAEDLLNLHAPERGIPVDIEEIVEFGLELEIRPFRGLCDRFNREGFLTADLATIFVDAERMENPRSLNRYRFTLAHEVGHLILHADYIRATNPDTPEDWKKKVQTLSPQADSRLEWQANEFAGNLLVPRNALATAWDEGKARAIERGIDIDELGDYGVGLIAGWVGKSFLASTQTVLIALRRDSLIQGW